MQIGAEDKRIYIFCQNHIRRSKVITTAVGSGTSSTVEE